MSLQYKEERKYFDLIQKAGSWNRYQFYAFFILSITTLIEGLFIFGFPFLFHQSQYQCVENKDSCQTFVCSLLPIERQQYIELSPFRSLADDIGDFRCDNTTLAFLQSWLFISSLIGVMGLTFFAQGIGRKNSLVVSCASTLVGLLLIYFCNNNLLVLSFGIFFTIAGAENGNQLSNCFAPEIVAQTGRITFINGMNMIQALSIPMNALLYFGLKDWKIVILWFYIFPALLVLLGAIFIIQKTPIDLLKSEDPSQILVVMQKIAKMNNIDSSGLTYNYINNLQIQYRHQSIQKQARQFSAIDICRYKSVLRIFVAILINLFAANYLFFSPSIMNTSNSDQDLFRDNIITGIAFFSSVLLVYLFTKYFKRRSAIWIYLTVGTCFLLVLMTKAAENGSQLYQFIFFSYRLIVSTFIQTMYIINYESYPTQIRASAALLTASLASTSGIVQTWIVKYCNNHQIDVKLSFLLIIVISAISNIFIKQTYDSPPPQIIEQLHETQIKKLQIDIN